MHITEVDTGPAQRKSRFGRSQAPRPIGQAMQERDQRRFRRRMPRPAGFDIRRMRTTAGPDNLGFESRSESVLAETGKYLVANFSLSQIDVLGLQ
jgi:hypothetical protein